MGFKAYDQITGNMFIDNYDLGVIQSIGHDLNFHYDTSDPDLPCFRVDIPGASQTSIPIYMADPNVVFVKKKFPSIVVTRGDFTPALERWHGVGQLDYRAGVSGTQIMVNDTPGFSVYQTKLQAVPYNIPYTISIFDFLERNVQVMLKKVLKAFYPQGKLFCKDSLGHDRTYDIEVEGGVSQINEIIDASRRVKGYSVEVMVFGELDLLDPTTSDSVSGITLNLERLY